MLAVTIWHTAASSHPSNSHLRSAETTKIRARLWTVIKSFKTAISSGYQTSVIKKTCLKATDLTRSQWSDDIATEDWRTSRELKHNCKNKQMETNGGKIAAEKRKRSTVNRRREKAKRKNKTYRQRQVETRRVRCLPSLMLQLRCRLALSCALSPPSSWLLYRLSFTPTLNSSIFFRWMVSWPSSVNLGKWNIREEASHPQSCTISTQESFKINPWPWAQIWARHLLSCKVN